MPDIATGIVEGGAEATDLFEAALEAKGVKGGGASVTPSVVDGLTFGGTQEPATVAPAATADETGTTTEGEGDEEPLHEDPEIAAYLEKFGGDPDKALQAAVEAQRLLGKQGNELGDLRQTVAKLEGAVEQLGRTPASAESQIRMSLDEIETAILENSGQQVATWAANEAPHLLETVLAKWGEDEPYAALSFKSEYKEWKAAQNAPEATTPKPSTTEEYVKNEIQGQRMQKSLDVVAGEYDPAIYASFKEYLPQALEAVPKIVKSAVISEDNDEQLDGLRIVFERAERLKNLSLATDAKAAKAAKDTVVKQTARVTSTSQAKTPEAIETDTEEGVKKFKASILAAETTSVADGLTFGKV